MKKLPTLTAILVAFLLSLSSAHGQDLSGTFPGTIQSTGSTTPRTLANRFAEVADVLDYGAKGNGTADVSSAVQAAINSLGSSGGTVLFPPGDFCIKSGLSVTTYAVIFKGPGSGQKLSVNGPAVLDSCGADTTIVTLNQNYDVIQGLAILGSQVLTTTHDAVVIGASCVLCIVRDTNIEGGHYGINVMGVNNTVTQTTVFNTYGSALVYITGQANILQSKLDQLYPYAVPSPGSISSISAWASTHSYLAGNIVSLGGFYIQATAGGTSGGSAPTLLNYGASIVDGSVTWKLMAPATFYGLQLDTGASGPTEIIASDMTGAFTAGFTMTNTGAGTAPNQATIAQSSLGEGLTANVLAHDGSGLQVVGSNISNCVLSTCAGISTTGSWSNSLIATGNLIIGNKTGISLGAGTKSVLTGNHVAGSGVAGVGIAAGITDFTIAGNDLSASAAWGTNLVGVSVASGASDYYTIANNNLNGATTPISDGGTGQHKTILNDTDGFLTGTWTAAIVGSGTAGTFSYANQTGYYEKMGRHVSARVLMNVSGTSISPTGNLTITGLPFLANSASGDYGICSFGFVSNLTLDTNYLSFSGYVASGANVITPVENGSARGAQQLAAANLSNSTPMFMLDCEYNN